MKKFTDKGISNLKPKEKKYYQREGDGFTIRVLPSGVKTWLFVYTFDGRRRELNLGTYPDKSLADAKRDYSKAYAILHDKENPRDPQTERDQRQVVERQAREDRRQHPTIEKLVEEYLTKHAKVKKTSWKEDERILNKDVVPVWAARKTEDITRRDVLLLLDGMQGRGDGIVMNTFKIIRRMFRFAVKQEIISTTPCYGFEKGEELPRPVSRERNLSEAEIRAFWTGLDCCAISNDIRSVLKMILLTGQRPGEVVSMHANEIDGRWWEFTPKETKITKETPRKQRIYLSDMAMELIGDSKGYKFPSPQIKTDEKGNSVINHITERAITYALRRNLLTHVVIPKPATWKKTSTKAKKSKKPFVVDDSKKLNIAKFTPHDLRRTCATMLSQLDFKDEVVDAILAHLKKGEIKTYNRNQYDREKQMALEAWERKLTNIITKKASNVVLMKRRKA